MKKFLFSLCITIFSSIFAMEQQLSIAQSSMAKQPSRIFQYVHSQHQKQDANFDQFIKGYNDLYSQIIPALNEYAESDHIKTSLNKLKTYCNQFGIKPHDIEDIKDAAQTALDKSKQKSLNASGTYAQVYLLNPCESAGALKKFGDSRVAHYNAYVNKAYLEVFETVIQQPTVACSSDFFDFASSPNFEQDPNEDQFFQKYEQSRNLVIWGLFSYAKPDHVKDQLAKLKELCSNSGFKPRNIEIKAAAQVVLDNVKEQSTQAKILANAQAKDLFAEEEYRKLGESEEFTSANMDHVKAFDELMNKPQSSQQEFEFNSFTEF